jgi:hypothetical protein
MEQELIDGSDIAQFEEAEPEPYNMEEDEDE